MVGEIESNIFIHGFNINIQVIFFEKTSSGWKKTDLQRCLAAKCTVIQCSIRKARTIRGDINQYLYIIKSVIGTYVNVYIMYSTVCAVNE
jgi:hypothetical protein